MQLELLDYRRFTGKFIIYGESGIGKEYLGNLKIFEGFILKGESGNIYIDLKDNRSKIKIMEEKEREKK